VLIRFVGHGDDHKIVEEIEKIINTYAGWKIERDGTNNPPLPRAKDFKVLFETGYSTVIDEVALAFSEADLLGGVKVSGVLVDQFEQRRIVIRVLPS